MVKKFGFLFLVLIIEGASLMSVELMGAKLLAPFYGSSLYVWTAILAITVLGLTLGYHFGGKLSTKHATEKRLVFILSVAAVLVFLLPATAHTLIAITSGMSLIPGICVASFFLLVPPMFCFGLVGPMVVRLMTQKMEALGNVAGTTYFTSTSGGIFATFLFGYILIPELGLKFSSLITGLALTLLPLTYLLKGFLLNGKTTLVQEPLEIIQTPEPETKNLKSPKIQAAKQKMPKVNTPIKTSFYLFAALEGGAGMAVELLSARMLAPYFGSSLYVWVAVIGITLLSLAFGYYLGGILAGKRPGITTIYWVLLIASGFVMLMPYLSVHLTVALMGLDLRLAAVFVSLLFVFPAELFLGMVPTLLIRYLTDKIDNSGATTGKVFTLSSASAILTLPILGFFVIPQFGLTGPSILIGVLIGIVPLVKLVEQKSYVSILMVLVMLFSLSQRTQIKSSPNLKVLSFSEGLLGQVLVADVFKTELGKTTNDRFLFINRMGQTNLNRTSNISNWNYIPFATAIASKLPENSNALLLGLGGGSAANVLHNQLRFQVDAIELDDRIGKVAQKYFALSPGVHVIIDDARHYLETTHKTYDLIFFDVFKGDIQPPHVLTVECFTTAKALLNKNGLIIVNFHGFISNEIGIPGRSVYATLLAAGLDTKLFPTPGIEEERNSLFIASIKPQIFHQVRSPLLHLGIPVDIDTMFLNVKNIDMKNALVFRDDKPILDRLNLKANELWRKAYNELSTRFFLNNGVPLFN
jgi:predicted membrane-bound spermidine synthase